MSLPNISIDYVTGNSYKPRDGDDTTYPYVNVSARLTTREQLWHLRDVLEMLDDTLPCEKQKPAS